MYALQLYAFKSTKHELLTCSEGTAWCIPNKNYSRAISNVSGQGQELGSYSASEVSFFSSWVTGRLFSIQRELGIQGPLSVIVNYSNLTASVRLSIGHDSLWPKLKKAGLREKGKEQWCWWRFQEQWYCSLNALPLSFLWVWYSNFFKIVSSHTFAESLNLVSLANWISMPPGYSFKWCKYWTEKNLLYVSRSLPLGGTCFINQNFLM